MNENECTAFEGTRIVASGDVLHVATKTKEVIDRTQNQHSILIFDDHSSELIEIDFRGSLGDVLKRLEERQHQRIDQVEEKEAAVSRGPGRPRLGVVSREVTLMPRQWDWLNSQPGGASVALRKLVDEARKANASKDTWRQAQNATYKFMSAMAGDFEGFEEASRALFANKQSKFFELIALWPADVQSHIKKLSSTAFAIEDNSWEAPASGVERNIIEEQ